MTTVSLSNSVKPAPKWYRITKRVIYLLVSGSILGGTLKRFGITDGDALLIMGWMTTIGEILGILLGNSEVFAKPEDLKDGNE